MINLQYLRNLNYFVSIRLFLRRNVKGRVLAYNKLKLSIHKKSSLLIKDTKFLIINADWNSESNQSGLIVLRKNALLKVNDNFKIYDGHKIIIKPNAKLELGSGYINSSVNINCSKEIIIGYGVAIAENVVIRDSDSHYLSTASEMTEVIHIGNKVWIGINATILKGVKIGDGAVVAAGTIVTKDVPSKALVAGTPARIIKENVEWGNITLENFNKKINKYEK